MFQVLLLLLFSAGVLASSHNTRATGSSSPTGRTVQTPFGVRPAECVITVADGAVITDQPEAGNVLVTHPSGARKIVVAPEVCHGPGSYKGYTRPERNERNERKKRKILKQPRATNDSTVPNGWYDNAYIWHYVIDEHVYSNFSATYTVPTDPTTVKDQILYYFIGLQDEGQDLNILQPVLTWGQEYAKWSVGSWACCPQNITFRSSILKGLQTGDTVDVSITRDDASTWKVDSVWKGQNVTLNAHIGNYYYNYADVTLELYSVKSCDELAGPFTFSNIVLYDQKGLMKPPPWQTAVGQACNGRLDIDHQNGDITVY